MRRRARRASPAPARAWRLAARAGALAALALALATCEPLRQPKCMHWTAPVAFVAEPGCGPGGLVVVEDARTPEGTLTIYNRAALGLPPAVNTSTPDVVYTDPTCPFKLADGGWKLSLELCLPPNDDGGAPPPDGAAADKAPDSLLADAVAPAERTPEDATREAAGEIPLEAPTPADAMAGADGTGGLDAMAGTDGSGGPDAMASADGSGGPGADGSGGPDAMAGADGAGGESPSPIDGRGPESTAPEPPRPEAPVDARLPDAPPIDGPSCRSTIRTCTATMQEGTLWFVCTGQTPSDVVCRSRLRELP